MNYAATQLTLVCYTCVYLRYMKDGSFLLAALATVIVSLADFLHSLTTTYLKHGSTDSDSSVVRAVVLKAIRYLQILILLQTAYLVPFHAMLGSPGGFLDLRIVGERDSPRSWQLWALDLAVTLLELALITEAVAPDLGHRRLAVPQLQTHRYGLLSLLRFDSWAPAVCREGPELSIITRKPSSTYGATTSPPDVPPPLA